MQQVEPVWWRGRAAAATARPVLSAALLSQPAVTATINLSGTTRSYPLLSQLLCAVVIGREGLRQKKPGEQKILASEEGLKPELWT